MGEAHACGSACFVLGRRDGSRSRWLWDRRPEWSTTKNAKSAEMRKTAIRYSCETLFFLRYLRSLRVHSAFGVNLSAETRMLRPDKVKLDPKPLWGGSGQRWLACTIACLLPIHLWGADIDPAARAGQPRATQTFLPAPAQTPAQGDAAWPEIVLTGMVRVSSERCAWFAVIEPGQTPKAYALRVGQKVGELELQGIDFRSGAVRVRYRGTELVLTFKANSTQNESVRQLVLSRDYLERVRPFVEDHARAHELREQREQERRNRERAAAAARAVESDKAASQPKE